MKCPAVRVEGEPSDFIYHGIPVAGFPFQQGIYPDNQFAYCKGLAYVVSGAGFESFYYIFRSRAGRKEEYGSVLVRSAQLFHEGETVHYGHHDVGDYDVRFAAGSRFKGLSPVMRNPDCKALSGKRVGDYFREVLFVLYEQKPYFSAVRHGSAILKTEPPSSGAETVIEPPSPDITERL